MDIKQPLAGTRSTKQRQAILAVFADDHVHLSADEVYLKVRSTQPNISLGTVYRNLDRLTKQGFLTQFTLADGSRKYEKNTSHHHHLVCIDCGETKNIPGCPLERHIENCSKENAYQIVRHSLEIYGYCPNCNSKSGKPGLS